MKHLGVFVLLPVLLSFSCSVVAQVQPTPVSDPKALALVAQSLARMTSGVVITDVTLSGNATLVAGSDVETGTVSLKAKGFAEARVDLNLTKGQRSEIRNNSNELFQGAWIGTDGVLHPFALHNCFINPNWFFSPLASLSAAISSPNVILSYLGSVSTGGRSFQHLQSYLFIAGQPVVAKLSTLDFYLDSTTLLPAALDFNTHPDDDFGLNIPVEIDFSNYQAINGVQVPLHVQKFLNGTVTLDVVIDTATFNSGLPDSPFSIP